MEHNLYTNQLITPFPVLLCTFPDTVISVLKLEFINVLNFYYMSYCTINRLKLALIRAAQQTIKKVCDGTSCTSPLTRSFLYMVHSSIWSCSLSLTQTPWAIPISLPCAG